MSHSVRPLFGEYTSFAKAYPQVREIRLEVEETGDMPRPQPPDRRTFAPRRPPRPLPRSGGV